MAAAAENRQDRPGCIRESHLTDSFQPDGGKFEGMFSEKGFGRTGKCQPAMLGEKVVGIPVRWQSSPGGSQREGMGTELVGTPVPNSKQENPVWRMGAVKQGRVGLRVAVQVYAKVNMGSNESVRAGAGFRRVIDVHEGLFEPFKDGLRFPGIAGVLME